MKTVIVAIACSLGVLNIWVAFLEVAKKKRGVLNKIFFSIKEACAAVKVFQSKESSVKFLTYQKPN